MADPSSETRALLVGVISDTHGLFDPQLDRVFAGVDHILHAGDMGAMAVLDRLAAIAPVTAVRGNVDHEAWAWSLPEEAVVELNGRRFLLAHVKEHVLRRHDPTYEGFRAVITGHSHVPAIDRRDGVLYLNPGSAGRRRFRLPRAVALLTVPPAAGEPQERAEDLEVETVILEEGSGTGHSVTDG